MRHYPFSAIHAYRLECLYRIDPDEGQRAQIQSVYRAMLAARQRERQAPHLYRAVGVLRDSWLRAGAA